MRLVPSGSVIAVTVFTLLVQACGPQMVSPPARFAMAELSSPPTAGKYDVHASTSFHATDSPDLWNMQGGIVYGVSDSTLVQVDTSFTYIGWNGAYDHADISTVGSARVGLGFAPDLKRRPIRLTGGVGAGGSQAGLFIAPDIGINVAFENPYIVPFLNYSLSYSSPDRGAELEVVPGTADPDESLNDPDRTEPVRVLPTVAMHFTLGMAIQLQRWPRWGEAAARRGQIQRGWALLLAAHLGSMSSDNAGTGTSGYSIGVLKRF